MQSQLLSNSGYLFSLMQNSNKTVLPSWVRLDPVRSLSNPDKASVALASLPRSLPHSRSILPLRIVLYTHSEDGRVAVAPCFPRLQGCRRRLAPLHLGVSAVAPLLTIPWTNTNCPARVARHGHRCTPHHPAGSVVTLVWSLNFGRLGSRSPAYQFNGQVQDVQ